MAKRTAAAGPRDMSVTVKVSAQEYQLIAYAASRSRARGVNAWMRDQIVAAARQKVSDETAAEILAGKATADLLKESLHEARRRKGAARVLEFRRQS
ncbi:MAG: hypothetical protein ACM36C_03905, partial [Acidobacteriota bacterium]